MEILHTIELGTLDSQGCHTSDTNGAPAETYQMNLRKVRDNTQKKQHELEAAAVVAEIHWPAQVSVPVDL